MSKKIDNPNNMTFLFISSFHLSSVIEALLFITVISENRRHVKQPLGTDQAARGRSSDVSTHCRAAPAHSGYRFNCFHDSGSAHSSHILRPMQILFPRDNYPTCLRGTGRSLLPKSELASPVEETSSAPVRSRISLAFLVQEGSSQ
jgi:hypothetical protein